MIPEYPSTSVSMNPEPPAAITIFMTPFTSRKNTKSPSCSKTLYCESLLNPTVAPRKVKSPTEEPPACLSHRDTFVFANTSITSSKSVK